MTAPRASIADRLRDAVVARMVPRHGRRPVRFARLVLRSSGAPRQWVPDAWKTAIHRRHLANWLADVAHVPVSDGRAALDPPWPDETETCAGALILHRAARNLVLLRAPDAAVIAGGAARLDTALTARPGAVLAYGDAIYRGPDGRVTGHWLKPVTPDPLLVAQGLLLQGVVAVRADAPGVADMLAALRAGASLCAELASFAAGLPADALVSCAAPVTICTPPAPLPRAAPPLPDPLPVASVLIPTRNGWDVLGPCLDSLRATDWPRDRLEIVVIDNGSDDAETLRQLDALAEAGEITLLRDTGSFNFSRLNNAAARVARGALLVMLNNDTTARDAGWLRTLAAQTLQPGIGAVGCKLLYPDGAVQHAGFVCGIRGGAQHVFVGIAAEAPGYNHLAAVDRSVSAVTAACFAVTRAAFDAVGGLREDLAVSYNDVVFCADLLAAGYRNVCVAAPLFVHHESRSRGRDTDRTKRDRHRSERARAIALHPDLFAQDPFYSPHLSRKVAHAILPH